MKPPPVTKTMTGAGAVRFAGTKKNSFSIQYFFFFRLKPLHSYFSLIKSGENKKILSLKFPFS
jgi:hypothetical protein